MLKQLLVLDFYLINLEGLSVMMVDIGIGRARGVAESNSHYEKSN